MKELATDDGVPQELAAQRMPILMFRMKEQGYGLPITAVRQLIEMVAIVKLPEAPPAIQGVINVRGEIVPVMDLRQRFGLTFLPYHLHTPIILVEANGRSLGLVVDEVEAVVDVHPQQVQAGNELFFSSSQTSAKQIDCLDSVTKINDQIVLILNADRLLGEELGSKWAHKLTRQQPNSASETDSGAELVEA